MVKVKLVLDSNEFILYFGTKSEDITRLFAFENVTISLTDLIIKEVIRNIRTESIKEFINLLKNPKFEIAVDYIPQDLINKYRNLGFKKGDIVIAAFCESIKADYLVTENRHFLKSTKFEFEVLNLKELLVKLK